MREAVRGICASFGPEYTRRKTEEGEPPRELWEALAEKGYLGVNIPERYGGGGLGMHALQAVGEEISRLRLRAAADRRLAGDRRLDPRPPRHRGASARSG